MNFPTITPERAAELRALADECGSDPTCPMIVTTRLRDFATLIDTVLDGGDVVTDDLVLAIEREVNGRRGIGWDAVDDEIQDEIRAALAKIITTALPAIRLRWLAERK